MTDKMRIEGLSYPDNSNDKARQSYKRPTAICLRHFIWLLVLGALVTWVSLFGTPHLRYIYTYTGTSEQPYYRSCYYVGWNSQQIFPYNGRCPLIKLLKSSPKGRT